MCYVYVLHSENDGKFYTEIVPDWRRKTPQPVIRGCVSPESVIHSDSWRAYNGLVDLGYRKKFRAQHAIDQVIQSKYHINGIESSWGYAKTRFSKLRGMSKFTFYLHLKECESRFKHSGESPSTTLPKGADNSRCSSHGH